MTVNKAPPEIVSLGKYDIVRELGRGSMGVVYEGIDTFLDRPVALKTIRKDLLQHGSQDDANNVLQRFRREAKAAARLNHPNVVVVYDYAEEGDTVYIAMELVQGKELKEFFQTNHTFELKAALDIMLQLLDGLAYSHRHNVVHRDIKPANIILVDSGKQVKITDFGIARVDTSELTQAGEIMGTPTHMAPEQLLGQKIDGRADLFSAGVILYQLLTKEKAFTGKNITAVMQSVLTSTPIPPTQHNPRLPSLCDTIISKALAKDANDRYQSAEEFSNALRELYDIASTMPAEIKPQAASAGQLEEQADLPGTLEEWVKFLTDRELPIFSRTARRISQAMHAPSFGAIELAHIIQQDPTLTAKLLKLGNSPYYNPSRQKLPNINRAIIILGVKNIHNLALACSYVEAATASSNEEVSRLIAHSLHSAVQAKSFAQLADDPYPEEIFVAALMNNFGQVAFWCYGQNACTQIRKLVASGVPSPEAEQRVLGFTLKELDSALCKAWNLGGLIEECAGEIGPSSSYRARLAHYSNKLVNNLEHGLDDPHVEDSLGHIAHITQKTVAELRLIALNNAEQAVKVAAQLGAGDVGRYIYHPPLLEDAPPSHDMGGISSPPPASIDEFERTRVLQEISIMLNGNIDISELIEKVMDGIQKAIYIDRVLFALITPNRAAIREKTSKGVGRQAGKGVMEFNISGEKNIFSAALSEKGGSWFNPRTDRSAQKLFTPSVREQLGQNECFAMPVVVNSKTIGLFYADRAINKHPLDLQSLHVFVELVQQANIGITLSKKQN